MPGKLDRPILIGRGRKSLGSSPKHATERVSSHPLIQRQLEEPDLKKSVETHDHARGGRGSGRDPPPPRRARRTPAQTPPPGKAGRRDSGETAGWPPRPRAPRASFAKWSASPPRDPPRAEVRAAATAAQRARSNRWSTRRRQKSARPPTSTKTAQGSFRIAASSRWRKAIIRHSMVASRQGHGEAPAGFDSAHWRTR